MAAPSTRLILILTYLQVNFILNADGLTLPLQTITTKCESFPKKPQKINEEIIGNEKRTEDFKTSADTASRTTGTTTSFVTQILNNLKDCPSLNTQVSQIPTDSFGCPQTISEIANLNILPLSTLDPNSFLGPTNFCQNNLELPFSPTSFLPSNPLPCGLTLPLGVSSSVTSLTSPPLTLRPSCHCDESKIGIPNQVPAVTGSNMLFDLNLPLDPPSYPPCLGLKMPLVVSSSNSDLNKQSSFTTQNIISFSDVNSQPLLPYETNVFQEPHLVPTVLTKPELPTTSLAGSQRPSNSKLSLPLSPRAFSNKICSTIPNSILGNNQGIQSPLLSDSVATGLPVRSGSYEVNVKPNNYPLKSFDPPSLPVNQNKPIEKYFKDVRAVTAKLNDFISSFSSRINLTKTAMPSLANVLSSPKTLLKPKIVPSTQETTPEIPIPTAPSTPACDDSPVTLITREDVVAKAPIIPQTIITRLDYPICSAPVRYNNYQDSVVSLSCNNLLPYSFNSLPVSTSPLKPYHDKFSNAPFLPLKTCDSTAEKPCSPPKSFPSVTPLIKRPSSSCSVSTTPAIFPNDNRSIPNKLNSDTTPPVKVSKKPFPYLSSITINTTPVCEQSVINSNQDFLRSPTTSSTSPEILLGESQIDLCCKDLEKVIALLELSLALDDEVNSDLDALNSILTSF